MALRLNVRASATPALAETGIEVMAAAKTAPKDGIIRNEQTGLGRRIKAGAVIPNGWVFDDGKFAATKKPAENAKGKGPSETA